MKKITRKNYECEIKRLVSVLVQQKITAEADKQIKKLLAENLENYNLIKINSTRWDTRDVRQTYIDSIIKLCETVVHLEFNSQDDIEVKKNIADKLSQISIYENRKGG